MGFDDPRTPGDRPDLDLDPDGLTDPGRVCDPDSDLGSGPDEPRADFTTRLARSMTGALMLGVGGTLQELYEGRPKQEIPIIAEAPDDEPHPDDDIWIEFDPDDPSRTIVHLRNRPVT